jgi:hypothetical protein
MTRQYILGELSVLIAELRPQQDRALADKLSELQHRVERAPLAGLVPLVQEAIDLADAACWRSLDGGNLDWFRREARGAADLREFAVCAGLLR